MWFFPSRVINLPAPVRYALASGAAALSMLGRLAFDPLWGLKLPFIFAFPAIVVSSWLGGFGPGMLTTALYAVAAFYLWIEPARSWAMAEPADALALVAFLFVGAAISALNEVWRRATVKSLGLERQLLAQLENERSARAEADEAAQQLRVALEAGRMGTWQWTMATGELHWSSGLEAIHGYGTGTFPRTFEAFRAEIHPEDRDNVLAAIAESVAERRDHRIEYRIVRRDGGVRWVEGRGQLVRDAGGNPVRLVGICLDTTDRKETESALTAARQAAESANRAKDHFLANLSHELRTPLQAVLAYTHLLSSGGLASSQFPRATEAIRRNAQAQADLIDALLDVARIDAGKLELQLDQVNLSALVSDALDVVRPAADAKTLTWKIDLPEEHAWTNGDGPRLRQVVSNILSNAVKFTPEGGRIEVGIHRVDSRIELTVTDTGQGIGSDLLPHIFERFRQADARDGKSNGGLGLGLAIVRELIAAHGGSVTAASAGEGQGSTFTITLPVLQPMPAGERSGAAESA